MATRKETDVVNVHSQQELSLMYINKKYIKTNGWIFPPFKGLLSVSMNVRLFHVCFSANVDAILIEYFVLTKHFRT